MAEIRCIYQQILRLVILFALALLVACLPAAEEPITPIAPGALPNFLEEVYPDQGGVVSLDDYAAEVCVQVDACELIREGDFWEFENVYTRTTILVDNQPTGGQVGYVYGLLMGCYMEDSQGNELAHAGGPYEWCVCAAPIAVGVHRVDMSFERSNGEIVSFAWTFELVSGPVPTPTSLPAPLEVDRVGYLPGYVEAVFPLPGETFLPPQYLEGWSDLLEGREMPPVRLTGPDMQPVCVALEYSELLELGTLPSGNHFYDRIYLTVDVGDPGDWLYPMSGHPIPGWTVSQCIETALVPGEHIAILYVDPFDANLVIYSWAFTVEEH